MGNAFAKSKKGRELLRSGRELHPSILLKKKHASGFFHIFIKPSVSSLCFGDTNKEFAKC
jgi:hypothetical protein